MRKPWNYDILLKFNAKLGKGTVYCEVGVRESRTWPYFEVIDGGRRWAYEPEDVVLEIMTAQELKSVSDSIYDAYKLKIEQ